MGNYFEKPTENDLKIMYKMVAAVCGIGQEVSWLSYSSQKSEHLPALKRPPIPNDVICGENI